MLRIGGMLLCVMLCIGKYGANAQAGAPKELKFALNEDGSNYIRFTGLAQVWLRHTGMNPGTTINGYNKESYSDISIRRLRFQMYGQLSDRVFFYTQFGQNNFNFQSTKFTGAFFHDALLEYAVDQQKLSFGAGLAGWSGLSRYASPSIGSILSLDAPLYQQATNGVNDQFIRKLSVYAKGQLGKFDYRLAISHPMTVTGMPAIATVPASSDFEFSNEPPKKQFQGYFKYMFFDKESNTTPYHAGTYLGSKRMFNVGAGFVHQADAMWAMADAGETVRNAMTLAAVDIFLETPLDNNALFTWYAAFTNYDFGSGYLRNIGVNNPANGSATSTAWGNAYPMVGTGNGIYTQLGYMLGKVLPGTDTRLQPFTTFQWSDYTGLNAPVLMYEAGFNLLLRSSHSGKLSAMYQGRSIFDASNDLNGHKGMTVLQYQATF